jgi:hypothetical protein
MKETDNAETQSEQRIRREEPEEKQGRTGLKTGHYKRKTRQGCRRYQMKRARMAYDE